MARTTPRPRGSARRGAPGASCEAQRAPHPVCARRDGQASRRDPRAPSRTSPAPSRLGRRASRRARADPRRPPRRGSCFPWPSARSASASPVRRWTGDGPAARRWTGGGPAAACHQSRARSAPGGLRIEGLSAAGPRRTSPLGPHSCEEAERAGSRASRARRTRLPRQTRIGIARAHLDVHAQTDVTERASRNHVQHVGSAFRQHAGRADF